MKLPINLRPSVSLALLAFVLASSAPAGERESIIYAKIILPVETPDEGEHPTVEPWISQKLRAVGQTKLRAVTDWVRLPEEGQDEVDVWDAKVDGKPCGCPIFARATDRSEPGKVIVDLDHPSPFGGAKATTLKEYVDADSPDEIVPHKLTMPSPVGSRAFGVFPDQPERPAFVVLLACPSQTAAAGNSSGGNPFGKVETDPGQSFKNTIELLLSPAKSEQRKGEARAARHAAVYRDAIIADLKDPMKPPLAAFQLRMLVSPWERGIAAGQEHKGSMTLPRPRRPVARPLDGPHHQAYREALLEALRSSVDAPKYDGQEYAVESLCQTLTEIGDSARLSEMARLLAKTDEHEIGYPILER